MSDYPDNKIDTATLKHLEDAADLVLRGKSLKANPAQLRLVLVDLQVVRWHIGLAYAKAGGYARDSFRRAYNANRQRTMSSNAAYKEAETDVDVVQWKNTRDILETAYNVIKDFVSTNQTSVNLAKEEAKNNL